MTRICLCLLIALASATVAAREVKLSDANGAPSCQHKAPADANPRTTATASPKDTKIKPTVHSDANAGGHLQSPRWHSFLPGMFR